MNDDPDLLPRLKDVGERAGVSTATVSRVLHNSGYVSASSRERVERAIRETGYRLNAVAQGLRTKRTITLGVMLHGVLPNPFSAEVAIGAERAAAEQGFNVLIFNAQGDAAQERQGVEALLTRRVDAIVFTTSLDCRNVQLVLDAGVPAVEVERRLCKSASAVVVDNYVGAREAVDHLIELGHQRIGYIGASFPVGGARDTTRDSILAGRFDAYYDALVAAGASFDNACVVQDEFRDPGGLGGLHRGASYMRTLLGQASDITAVFAASDLLAAGALQVLYEQSIRVPETMSVVGFDDTFARHLAPPLTSVRQPTFEMGFRSASLAIRLLKGKTTRTTERCATSLVVRESTSSPPVSTTRHTRRRKPGTSPRSQTLRKATPR